MGYIYCLGGFIEPSKSLGGKYEPSEKFRGQKQTLFYLIRCTYSCHYGIVSRGNPRIPNSAEKFYHRIFSDNNNNYTWKD
jgi:hypothetical protein